MNVTKLLTYSPDRFRRELGHIPATVLSEDEEQRYLLVNFIMLNPSTADAESDDRTIRRCKGLAPVVGIRTHGRHESLELPNTEHDRASRRHPAFAEGGRPELSSR